MAASDRSKPAARARSAHRLTDAVYAQWGLVCRYCEVLADTIAIAHGVCPATGKRHFLVSK